MTSMHLWPLTCLPPTFAEAVPTRLAGVQQNLLRTDARVVR